MRLLDDDLMSRFLAEGYLVLRPPELAPDFTRGYSRPPAICTTKAYASEATPSTCSTSATTSSPGCHTSPDCSNLRRWSAP